MLQEWLTAWKDYADPVQSTLTSIAIVIGGLWTLSQFFSGRFSKPKLTVSHSIEHWPAEEQVILHVVVRVVNVGSVLVRPEQLQVRVQQLLPLTEDVTERLRLGEDPVGPTETEVLWPLLCERYYAWKVPTEIEPGESDDYFFDFVIAAEVSAVQVYSHLPNPVKKGVGWNTTSVYYVSNGGARGQEQDRKQAGTAENNDRRRSRAGRLRETKWLRP
jgi:hypothetical protein